MLFPGLCCWGEWCQLIQSNESSAVLKMVNLSYISHWCQILIQKLRDRFVWYLADILNTLLQLNKSQHRLAVKIFIKVGSASYFAGPEVRSQAFVIVSILNSSLLVLSICHAGMINEIIEIIALMENWAILITTASKLQLPPMFQLWLGLEMCLFRRKPHTLQLPLQVWYQSERGKIHLRFLMMSSKSVQWFRIFLGMS